MVSNIGDLAGQTLGTCTLMSLLGQGGMGAVYLAHQARPSRNVAVKVLLPGSVTNDQIYQEFQARFRREADVIAKLEHVNIMPIYEYGEQDGLAYLVMPHLTGGSLRDVLLRRSRLSPAEAVSYIEQAGSALDYAHAQGVIHRDLKPANFLLHADGRLVLADFGIARMIENSNTSGATLTSAGTIIGTPEYMAPEMVSGESVDYRADIYELGVVLFQMLSGHVPFTASSPFTIAVKHIQQTLPLLHQTDPSIPAGVDNVIQIATAKKREDRYPSGQAMGQALRNASTGSAPATNNWRSPSTIMPSGGQALAGGQPLVLSPSAPQPPHNTPAYQNPSIGAPFNAATAYASQPPGAYGQTPYPPAAQPYATHATPYSAPKKSGPWGVIIGLLLAIVIIAGGAFAAIQFFGLAHNPLISTVTNSPVTGSTQSSGQVALPTGTPAYSTAAPNCGAHPHTWTAFRTTTRCDILKTIIHNTASQNQVGGLFLSSLQNYPTNYAIKARLQLDSGHSASFGLYLRSNPAGGYIFLINPGGSWSFYSYSNSTGTLNTIQTGSVTFNNPYAPVTITVASHGSQFSFYVDNTLIGNATDATYASGGVGIAIDGGGTVIASTFSIYNS